MFFKDLKKEKETEKELLKITKMLVKRDLNLLEVQRKREEENQILEEKLIQLEKSRIALLSILEDVQSSEKETKIQRKILDDTIQYFLHGIILLGKDQKILLTNQKVFKIFNIGKTDIKDKGYKALEADKNYIEILKSLLDEKTVEKEISFNEYHLKINKIIFKKNKEIDYLLIFNDITREKQIEKMKTEFVSVTAHQLRTPLSSMKWALQLLMDGDIGKITPEQKDIFEKTYQSNERVIKIVNDLLNVTKIEEGEYLHELILADIEKVIVSVISSLSQVIEEKKINLEFIGPKKKIPQTKIDVEKIKIVIQNFIENAIKYTHTDGKIIISLKKDKNNIEFKVQDTGIGISKKDQKRIFTKFFRSETALKIETDGSGLGLFISKNIVEAHNGKIYFKSEEGKGSIFYFTLPII